MTTDQPATTGGRATASELDGRTVAAPDVRSEWVRAALLPGRPPREVSWAGPTPDREDPTVARNPTRAICCSGGGIRAAAFALGGMQYLNSRTEGDSTVYGNTDFVTSVSGGGYIAGSYALVGHHLGTGPAGVYEPGSPEDNRLRAHTRYLIDSKTQLTISILGIIYGLLMNLAAILAFTFIVATLEGLAVGPHGLNALRLDGNGSTFSAHVPHPMVVALLIVLAAGATVYVAYRIVDLYRPIGDAGTTRWCVAAIALISAALGGLVLFVGVPSLLAAVNHAPATVAHANTGVQTGTIFGTITALVAIVQQLIRTYVPSTSEASSNEVTSTAVKKARTLTGRLGNRVLPWLGSIVIVVLLAVAFLTWVSGFVKAPHETGHWLFAGGCLVFLVIWRLLTDVNRTSLHRPYTQRLASAFAVSRAGADGDAPLSQFRGDVDAPRLVVCAAVNTDQPGSTPTGRHCAPFTVSAYTAGISSGTMFNQAGDGAFDLGSRESSGPDRGRWSDDLRGGKSSTRSISHQPGLWLDTSQFEDHARKLTLMDLVAVSGAAVSPVMGRSSRPSLRLVLGVANVRLGMWLPNPLHRRRVKPPSAGWAQRIWWQLRQPGLGSLAGRGAAPGSDRHHRVRRVR